MPGAAIVRGAVAGSLAVLWPLHLLIVFLTAVLVPLPADVPFAVRPAGFVAGAALTGAVTWLSFALSNGLPLAFPRWVLDSGEASDDAPRSIENVGRLVGELALRNLLVLTSFLPCWILGLVAGFTARERAGGWAVAIAGVVAAICTLGVAELWIRRYGRQLDHLDPSRSHLTR